MGQEGEIQKKLIKSRQVPLPPNPLHSIFPTLAATKAYISTITFLFNKSAINKLTMAPSKLEQEDHSRDAAFNKAMHKDSSAAKGGFSAMMKKDKAAQKAAVDEYFKHWDNKSAKDETPEIREVRIGSRRSLSPRTNLPPFHRPEKLNMLP